MSPITLNIGGTNFYTTYDTVHKYRSFFSNIHDSDIFIDRDPLHFRYILNFMRGSHVLPLDPTVLKELYVEADFYCLSELADNIKHEMKRHAVDSVSSIETLLERLIHKMG